MEIKIYFQNERRNIHQKGETSGLEDSLTIGAVAVGPLPNDFIRWFDCFDENVVNKNPNNN